MAVQTQIQVRRGTASSWTSTNPTLAAGEFGFETDTGKYKCGNGSSTWNALGYSSILPSTFTTKGDLLAATAANTPARLAVGADNSVLQADSSAASGVSWAGPLFAAGKNKIINGDFGIWQRGTSISLSNGAYGYTADRFAVYTTFSAGTSSFSQQTFTPGTAPVAGYEGTYFGRLTCGSTASYAEIVQRIEDVRTFAGQTVTFSFWAKASGTLVFAPQFNQSFGSGGSATVATFGSNVTLTTSWARYTATVTLPSISGKTIGTGSYLQLMMSYYSGTLNSATVDTWGWQLEAGSVATSFQTATGTIQGELAACQRYYYRNTGQTYAAYSLGMAYSTAATAQYVALPVSMRVIPSSVEFANLAVGDQANTAIAATSVTLSSVECTPNIAKINVGVASGLTQYRPYSLSNNNNAAGYLGFSAEL